MRLPVTQGATSVAPLGETGEFMPWAICPTPNGRLYPLQPPGQRGALASFTPTFNNLWAVSFVLAYDVTVDLLAIHVTTLASVARCGIYTAYDKAGSFFPRSLVVESGELDVSTTGQKSAAVSQVLLGGVLYYAAVLAGTSSPVIQGYGNNGYSAHLGVASGSLTSGGGHVVTVAQAYGAMPALFPTPTVTIANSPIVAIRISA